MPSSPLAILNDLEEPQEDFEDLKDQIQIKKGIANLNAILKEMDQLDQESDEELGLVSRE